MGACRATQYTLLFDFEKRYDIIELWYSHQASTVTQEHIIMAYNLKPKV